MEEFGPGRSFVHDYLIAGQNCSASVSGMLWDMRKIISKGWPWSLLRLQALLRMAGAGTADTGTDWGRLPALHSRLVVKFSPRGGCYGQHKCPGPCLWAQLGPPGAVGAAAVAGAISSNLWCWTCLWVCSAQCKCELSLLAAETRVSHLPCCWQLSQSTLCVHKPCAWWLSPKPPLLNAAPWSFPCQPQSKSRNEHGAAEVGGS